MFDEFLAIPTAINDMSTRSFYSFVQCIPEYPLRLGQQNDPVNRAIFDSISVTTYTYTFLQSIADEASVSGSRFTLFLRSRR